MAQYFNWPIAIALIAVIAMLLFRKSIRDFIGRLKTVKAPGVSIDANEQEQLPNKAKDELSIIVAETTVQSLTGIIRDLAAQAAHAELKAKTSENEKEEILQGAIGQILDFQRSAYFWWCRYLSLFFVMKTKILIYYVHSNENGYPEPELDNFLQTMEADEDQKRIMKDILIGTEIFTIQNGAYKITPRGRLFLNFEVTQEIDLDILGK
jgi:hypothetical protein